MEGAPALVSYHVGISHRPAAGLASRARGAESSAYRICARAHIIYIYVHMRIAHSAECCESSRARAYLKEQSSRFFVIIFVSESKYKDASKSRFRDTNEFWFRFAYVEKPECGVA